VEVVVPVREPALRDRLIGILDTALSDNRLAFELDSEGAYTQRQPIQGKPERNMHSILMKEARERSEAAKGWEMGSVD
jgi:polyphosphate kinase